MWLPYVKFSHRMGPKYTKFADKHYIHFGQWGEQEQVNRPKKLRTSYMEAHLFGSFSLYLPPLFLECRCQDSADIIAFESRWGRYRIWPLTSSERGGAGGGGLKREEAGWMEGGNFESGIDRQTSPETGDTPELRASEGERERGMEGFHGTLSTEAQRSLIDQRAPFAFAFAFVLSLISGTSLSQCCLYFGL